MDCVKQLYGLLLCGGKSRRMGRDKAALSYHDDAIPHAKYSYDLLSEIVDECFLSIAKPGLVTGFLPSFTNYIVDIRNDVGIVGSILTAFEFSAEVAWLVVACDLPGLNIKMLQDLRDEWQQSEQSIIAYRDASSGLPEPLCAIYQPSANQLLKASVSEGKCSPREIIRDAKFALLPLADNNELGNANTPDEYQRARNSTAMVDARLQINVLYFSVLRVQTKLAEERVETHASSVDELYLELCERHAIDYPKDQLRVAINEEFGSFDAPLAEGDVIAFMPPMSGG